MKKLFLLIIALISSTVALSQGIGISYEQRSESPQSGFGARFEMSLLDLKLVKLQARFHASYFSEENSLSANAGALNYTYSQEAKIWDAGVMGIVRVAIPFPVKPYAGVGVGFESGNVQNILESSNAEAGVANLEAPDVSNFTINGLIGLQLGIIPIVKPFVEYRVAGFTGETSDFNAPGRLQIGVLLSF